MATGRTNTISHITYATEWPHVNVAFIAHAEIDGETFDKPTEKLLSSPAVMNAVRALENAVITELAKDGPAVVTMRAVKEAARQAEIDAREALIAGKKADVEKRRPVTKTARKSSGRKKQK